MSNRRPSRRAPQRQCLHQLADARPGLRPAGAARYAVESPEQESLRPIEPVPPKAISVPKPTEEKAPWFQTLARLRWFARESACHFTGPRCPTHWDESSRFVCIGCCDTFRRDAN